MKEICEIPVLPNYVFQMKGEVKVLLALASEGRYVEIGRTSGNVTRLRNFLFMADEKPKRLNAFFIDQSKDFVSAYKGVDTLREGEYVFCDDCYICQRYDMDAVKEKTMGKNLFVRQSYSDFNDRYFIGEELKGLDSQIRVFVDDKGKMLYFVDQVWFPARIPFYRSRGEFYSGVGRTVLRSISFEKYEFVEEGEDIPECYEDEPEAEENDVLSKYRVPEPKFRKIIPAQQKKRILQVTEFGEVTKIYL